MGLTSGLARVLATADARNIMGSARRAKNPMRLHCMITWNSLWQMQVVNGTWVTRADKLPIQLGNSQMTVVDGMLCSRDASNATVSTQPNTVQRPLSANMTTAQLTSLTRVYLSSSTYRCASGPGRDRLQAGRRFAAHAAPKHPQRQSGGQRQLH